VEAAKADLEHAGHVADAQLLTKGRLNTAWYKLTPDMRAQYAAARTTKTNASSGKKRARQEHTQGDKKGLRNFAFVSPLAEAQTNSTIARDLGLNNPSFGAFSGTATTVEGADDEFRGRGFSITALVEENMEQDEHTYQHPMCGGVLSKSGTYDDFAKSTLIVRVSSAGLESRVGKLSTLVGLVMGLID
jgi:hypothetical protein